MVDDIFEIPKKSFLNVKLPTFTKIEKCIALKFLVCTAYFLNNILSELNW